MGYLMLQSKKRSHPKPIKNTKRTDRNVPLLKIRMWASFRDIATPTEMHSTSTESSVLRPVKKKKTYKKKWRENREDRAKKRRE